MTIIIIIMLVVLAYFILLTADKSIVQSIYNICLLLHNRNPSLSTNLEVFIIVLSGRPSGVV